MKRSVFNNNVSYDPCTGYQFIESSYVGANTFNTSYGISRGREFCSREILPSSTYYSSFKSDDDTRAFNILFDGTFGESPPLDYANGKENTWHENDVNIDEIPKMTIQVLLELETKMRRDAGLI